MAGKQKRADLRDGLLDVLGENGVKLRELQDENLRVVERLRELGTSWAEIGNALGSTRQAARKRYGPDAERSGNADRARGRTE